MVRGCRHGLLRASGAERGGDYYGDEAVADRRAQSCGAVSSRGDSDEAEQGRRRLFAVAVVSEVSRRVAGRSHQSRARDTSYAL